MSNCDQCFHNSVCKYSPSPAGCSHYVSSYKMTKQEFIDDLCNKIHDADMDKLSVIQYILNDCNIREK